MAHDFDDTLKKLVNANKEDFVRFVMPDQDVEVVDTLDTEFKRTVIADSMIQVLLRRIAAGIHLELWHAMSERLKDNWFYKEITEEAREQGREEERKKLEEERKELEEERKKLEEEERKQELEAWRQTMQRLVQKRFADRRMALLAKGQAAIITDLDVLQDLVLKLATARDEQEAQDYLLGWGEAS